MKIKSLALLLFLFGLAAGFAPRPALAQDEVSFNFFVDALKPYGDWVQVGDYGPCWRPADVTPDWAPYTDGYWAYTDGGWTWVSYEDYGGIVYHYGRWIDTDEEGWCWVPDYQWAPAWVSWRTSDDYVGWAPLPPECSWQPDVGVSVWADATYDIGPGWYHFCHFADFGAPVLARVLIPRADNVTIIASTTNITNITFNRGAGMIFVGGPRYDLVARRVGRPIPTLRLVQQTNTASFFAEGKRPMIQSLQKGNALFLPAPHMVRPVGNPLASVPGFKPVRVIAAAHVTKGWNLVKNVEERERLKKTIVAQTNGRTPQSAPARAFDPGELKVVPKKATATVDKNVAIDKNVEITKSEKTPKIDKTVTGEVKEPKIEHDKPLKPAITSDVVTEPKVRERPVEPEPIKRPANEAIDERKVLEKDKELEKDKALEKERAKESERTPKGPPPAAKNPNPGVPNSKDDKKGKHLTPEEAAALQGR